MAYELRTLGRQKQRYNSANDDNKLIYQLEVDGQKTTPTSATIAIYAPGETTVTLAATAMTVSGTLLTYTLSTTTVADYPVDTGYRAEIIVTVGSVTHDRTLMFDVVKYLLWLELSRDQLLDRDASLLGAEHAGNEDLRGLIIAARDELQIRLEAKATADKRLLEEMILDHAKLATVARLYILEMYWFVKNSELAARYEKKFDDLWRAFLAGLTYDVDGDGFEETTRPQWVGQKLML